MRVCLVGLTLCAVCHKACVKAGHWSIPMWPPCSVCGSKHMEEPRNTHTHTHTYIKKFPGNHNVLMTSSVPSTRRVWPQKQIRERPDQGCLQLWGSVWEQGSVWRRRVLCRKEKSHLAKILKKSSWSRFKGKKKSHSSSSPHPFPNSLYIFRCIVSVKMVIAWWHHPLISEVS